MSGGQRTRHGNGADHGHYAEHNQNFKERKPLVPSVESVNVHHEGRASSETGFVLIVVLWALLILSAIAIGLTYVARTRLSGVRALVTQQQNQLLADGMADVLAMDWARGRKKLVGRLGLESDGRRVACTLEGQPVVVSLTSVFGLVDLNAAPTTLLEKLIEGTGATRDRSQRVAAAIIDFRDADSVPVAEGAEEPAYVKAGLQGPKNAPFESLVELAQVLGVNRDLYERLRPLVTVASRAALVDRSVAPEDVRAALDSPETQTAAGTYGHGAEVSRTLRILVTIGNNRAVVRQMTVELQPLSPRGYQVLDTLTYREHQLPLRGGLTPCA